MTDLSNLYLRLESRYGMLSLGPLTSLLLFVPGTAAPGMARRLQAGLTARALPITTARQSLKRVLCVSVQP